MSSLSLVQIISVWIIPVLFAITFHEVAHAYVAHRCGDSTAKMLGRLSLNPMRHIDIIGTIIVPILVAMASQFHFVFGWAKPVPINWTQLRKPRRDQALVALAGPGANIAMAVFWALVAKVASLFINSDAANAALFFILVGQAGVVVNVILACINLIPVPPLDGSRVAASFMSPRVAMQYSRIEPYGIIILLLFYVTGILGWLIGPPIVGLVHLIGYVFGL